MATPQPRPGFDLSRMSTASKILLGGSLLYLIDSFLPWQRSCVTGGGLIADFCVSVSLWDGVGFIAALLAILILIMEVLVVANVEVNIGDARTRSMIEAGLAGGVLLFTILKILIDNEALYIWAWVGLILALAIGYGGYLRWTEAKVMAPPPGPSTTGGFTA
jgi:hypothetical protein